MNSERSFRLSLKIHGAIVLVASLLHVLWHWFLPSYVEMKNLTEIQWNIVFIFNWAVAFFLLLLSILSFGISRSKSLTLGHIRIFSALAMGFWISRLVLEFIFPVRIPFIIVQNPSLFLKFLIAAGIAILVFPEVKLRLAGHTEK